MVSFGEVGRKGHACLCNGFKAWGTGCVSKGKTRGNKQEIGHQDSFGANDIWIVLQLSERRGHIIIHQIDFKIWICDTQVVYGNKVPDKGIAEENVGFVRQVDEMVERAGQTMKHKRCVKNETVIFARLNHETIRGDH